MTELKNIPHLIDLLDDDSESVRRHILKELSSFGPLLKTEINRQGVIPNEKQEKLLDQIYQYQNKVELKSRWSSWLNKSSAKDKLELAMTMFAEYLTSPATAVHLTTLLDDLAIQYRNLYYRTSSKLLAKFLFDRLGLQGNDEDYYNPQNSNCVSVIQDKKGIPISLVCVYILVGKRLGLNIEGCHFPGHFLAKICLNGRYVFVDCYNGGQIMSRDEIINGRKDVSSGINEILNEKVCPETIVRRYLANLIRCFQQKGDERNTQLMTGFFNDIDYVIGRRKIWNAKPEDIIQTQKSQFQSGQVVRHKSYGYRGVVVAIDDFCMASDEWYYGNQTQPDRNQPWLHVFVDGSDQVTYVAQANILKDHGSKKIEHPLIPYFFKENEGEGYQRNANEWPKTDF